MKDLIVFGLGFTIGAAIMKRSRDNAALKKELETLRARAAATSPAN